VKSSAELTLAILQIIQEYRKFVARKYRNFV
jgi:hypothetical protein